jgi:DNA-binding XRE family transcriptional regulator
MTLLGQLIEIGRKQKKWSESKLAERAGINRLTLQKMERGDLKCEIGLVFEVAALVDIRLFDADLAGLAKEIRHSEEKLALLPRSIRHKKAEVKDDF